jgi:hypothetical protein
MSKVYIINYLAKKINAKKYLEIGIDQRATFDNVDIPFKVGVDPYVESPGIIQQTSDDFFMGNNKKFDLIFIDGLHHVDQVYRDIINSFACLNPDGIIICHNMLPTSEDMQIIPFRGGMWTGDCWKAFVNLRQTRADLEMFTIDIDMGLGVIKKGKQKKLKINDDLTYKNFTYYKYDWMNIYSLPTFYNIMDEKNILKALLDHFIQCPESPEVNFYMGCHYHYIKQTASAVSYYLRAAERTHDELMRYEALLRAGMCFDSQGSRNNSVEGMLQHAVALMPTRPEGYFYLSRFYERAQRWFDAYLISTIGDKLAIRRPSKLRTVLDYPGFYGIVFEKAVASWWTGLCEESRNIFKYLSIYEPLDYIHKQAVVTNLKQLNGWKDDSQFVSFLKTKDQELEVSNKNLSLYYNTDLKKLKYKFKDIESIDRNYSEAFQDMFILTLLNGKKQGVYLEIGAGFPFYGNNTYLLESKYEWEGISLDIESESSERYFRDRNNIAICRDATQVNYIELLEDVKVPYDIDYLQLDCDPPDVTYDILTKIPFDKYRFAIITYEHDYYNDKSKSYKQKSREYLLSKGYELILSNIAPCEGFDYEDWYIHPDLVNRNIINKIKNTDDTVKIAKDIFYGVK